MKEKLFSLLIVGNKERFFHLKQFSNELEKKGINTMLINDMDYLNKTFEINFKNRIEKNAKLKKILNEFQPNLVLFDRLTKIVDFVVKQNIPLAILLRGNYWKEAEYAKKNTDSKIRKIAIEKNIKLVDNCFKNSSLILAISTYLEKEARKKYPKNTIEFFPGDGRMPNEWNFKKSNKLKHPCVGLLQGLNIWGKSKEILLLKKVLNKFPEITFYFAGDGVFSEQIIPELKKFKNFVWLKQLKYPDEVMEFLSEIDLYLLLSGLEGLGQTIIEAALLKKPIIATNIGGIPDLISNNKTGILIDENNDKMLSEKLTFCFKNKEIIDKMGNNAYLDIKNRYSWSSISSKFIEIVSSYPEKFTLKKNS